MKADEHRVEGAFSVVDRFDGSCLSVIRAKNTHESAVLGVEGDVVGITDLPRRERKREHVPDLWPLHVLFDASRQMRPSRNLS